MRQVENKKVVIGNSLNQSYYGLIISVIKGVPDGGFSYTDIKKRIRIEDSISEEKETFSFEDSDWEYLKILVSTNKWGVYCKNLVTFIDDINNANQV